MREDQSCALRALTLCDGQVLEESPGDLTVCLCRLQRVAEDTTEETLAAVIHDYRQKLSDESRAARIASADSVAAS